MSGPLRKTRAGQLALMDAIVFFSVAILISSIILSQTYQEYRAEVEAQEFDAAYDVSSFLEVLLRGSIGEGLSLNVTGHMAISSATTIIECLAMEASALFLGESLDAFQAMNGLILIIAERMAGQQVVPHVWVLRSLNDSWVPIVEIEESPPLSENRRAAFFDLPADGVERCRITLVLEPALLSETRGI